MNANCRNDKIMESDNFLHLGGDSLTAIRIVNKIEHEFKVAIPIETLFERSTLKQLADYIESPMESERQLDFLTEAALSVTTDHLEPQNVNVQNVFLTGVTGIFHTEVIIS
jgi:acyl carrier protein